ncbi:exo-beta-N-acetylmuramidase NamZ domain-containing protein [Ekhidna sp.]|uniref:exo-beta-N-acetylmuramidase NamZ family protein n=1 Tax=Ekhidna sp. TaxID=2608089 RepID=UPI003B5B4F87
MQRLYFLLVFITLGCSNQAQEQQRSILPGAYQTDDYLPLIEDKKVGLTVNHSSLIEGTHLTDSLQSLGINIKKVFTPEHGFTGTISDGVKVEYENSESSFELISLYGENKKPSTEQMNGIEIMIFDIQDVGTRFYTYISTMHYVMEACAENDIPLLIFDRPNPNGSYVDGPVLDTALSSFVGMHPIPIVHGMTVGELAQMINEEGWLKNQVKTDLKIIKTRNWNHQKRYSLPVNPSPNLPNDLSIALYPSLCLFEGTIMSVGRGTDYAFQQIGHPDYPDTTHSFTPVSREGAKWPPYEDQRCYGLSWIGKQPSYAFSLQPLIEAYKKMNRDDFFNDYFKRLAGTNSLQKQIEEGQTEEEVRASWEPALSNFKKKRKQYLLYKD